jgi:2-succinyl-6-hydroxy-2,4-cyclohexadiene-1-carboxylate synthase
MTAPHRDIPLRFASVGDPSKPKVLFLHGFLGSGSDWLPVAQRLEPDYCSILVDLPGHGETGIPADADPGTFFSETVDALAAGLGSSSGKPCSLVGYSMGGRIALMLALRHPSLFRKAVIVSASPGLRTPEERENRRKSDEGIARKIERNFDGFIEAWYDQPLFSTLKAHPLFREIEAKRRQSSPANLTRALRLLGTGSQPPLWDEMPSNRTPLLFVVGEKDLKFVEIGRRMVTVCPLSGLEIVPECGHTVHLENRELFVDRLKAFFNTHQPT